ncbi:hypothetical protein MRB53_003063 [Persea americana]|uniref:Uncharacterized protein n=1 Tax=Persea americana TaxID=3435 RepID=A0ACC2MWM1_PERAE|nr:hypothetical protein MRB53_003063 [Persea americana]|eukprot:TRINITY_DN62472_c0_g1_i1.p1 TRINITY_DN62472_c0_g1~~TRINITY_DN62472_c0_g1_i1.p1  ORF type:complete len:192 (+),score=37.94 TRINITY_DN62472_c0_g1_i1:50-577(+)
MASNLTAVSFLFLIFMATTVIPPISACGYCPSPSQPQHKKPHPPHKKPPKTKPPVTKPPTIIPPIIVPQPTVTPPVTKPPCPPSPSAPTTCPIDALKLGLCVDLLGGLVHIGLGDPVVNVCCPVLQGLLELEAAICLCTALRLKVLNLNIFLPIALQLLVTCEKKVPPGFTCPPL